MRIDLNADVGELSRQDDERLLATITSASVAAGLHAGTPSVLRATVRRAHAFNVSVGAHPGLPDRAGFGRREQRLDPGEVEDLVLYQVAAVAGIAAAEGVRLRHVKLHGALYTMAARDRALAAAASRAVMQFDPALIIFGPGGSALIEAARDAGLAAAAEAFADRAYEPDGSLVSRSRPGALITDADIVVSRVRRLVRDGVVEAVGGTMLRIDADTLCVHGDTPGAAELARRVREALEADGISVQPPDAPLGVRGEAPCR